MESDRKLGLSLLILLGIGSMIGGGIFNSPTDFINKANPQATLIAWAIGGIGVICLALVFQFLANAKPELKGGIYSYARAGFGEFVGFNSAWGYWMSAFLGNVSFFILIFKTINSMLGEGRQLRPVTSFILASVMLWIYHFIISRGIRGAGIINAIVTIAKLLPLALVIIFGIFLFKPSIFFVPNWRTTLIATGDSVTVAGQIKAAMGTILWCFVGVEASVVLSERAKSARIVGTATVISLLITLGIYVLISTIAMGSVPAKTLANAGTPLAEVLGLTPLGRAGSTIMSLGLLTSLLGATLSWILLAAEIPYIAAKDGVMPKWFAGVNKVEVSINSLVATNILTQIFLVALLSERLQAAYNFTYYMATTTILIPYLFSALYALKVSMQSKNGSGGIVIGLIAAVYALYAIYAVGITYLGLAFVMYAIGIFAFVIAKKESKHRITTGEAVGWVILILIAVYMIYQLAIGKVTP